MTRSFLQRLAKHTISRRGVQNKKIRGLTQGSIKKSQGSYKKSVSHSLVYRSLKLDNDSYVGFKVTFSGKGRKGNYDRSRLSIILIPEISLVRSYRPIAGALARATKGEVYTCCYTPFGSRDDCVMSSIIDRLCYSRSKLRRIDVISQSSQVLSLFKERLSEVDNLFDRPESKTDSTETPDNDLELYQAQKSDDQVAMGDITRRTSHRRVVHLIKIDGRSSSSASSGKRNPNPLASVFKSIVAKIGNMFARREKEEKPDQEETESPVFTIIDLSYRISEKHNFANPFHCDLIAKEILGLTLTP